MMDRRLTAVMAADVVGYTSLVERDEAGTINRLRLLRTERIEPEIATRRGRVFKLAGDGIFAEFPSAVDAVECAMAVQRAVHAQISDLPPAGNIRLRIGIEIGDVIVEGEDLLGEGVNLAARIQEQAEPGEVWVSAKVAREVAGRVGFALEAQGERRLKNVAEPVAMFRVSPERPFDGLSGSSAPPLPGKPSIAVMPFENLGSELNQDYFADGLVEEIIIRLSKNPALFAIARNSTFAFKNAFPGVREVARRLGVRYVLQGSVRRSRNRVRISGQLVEAVGETCVWAERYEGVLEDVFDLQDQLTESIVGALEPSLRRAEIDRARMKRPENLDAYDLFLRALPHVYANTMTDVNEALRLLDLSLRLDSSNARAHANAAWCGEQRFFRGGFRAEDREEALEHARAALSLGGSDAQALSTGAFVLGNMTHDYSAALRALNRALGLSGDCALAYGFSALVNCFVGKFPTATEHAQKALRLSPLDPLNYHPHLALASVSLFTGHAKAAVAHASAAIDANPHFSVLHAMLVAGHAETGDMAAANDAAQILLTLAPEFTVDGFASMGVYRPQHTEQLTVALRKAGLK